jgi:hypothetical protein
MSKTVLLEPVAATIPTTTPVGSSEFEAVCLNYAKAKLELKEKLDKIKPLKTLVDDYEDRIDEEVSQFLQPEDGTTIDVGKYHIEVSARTREYLPIDKQELFKTLGATLFVELASFSITDLKKYLTGQQLDALLKYKHTGSRRMSVKKI